jgi:hypothetical protein
VDVPLIWYAQTRMKPDQPGENSWIAGKTYSITVGSAALYSVVAGRN